MTSPSQILGGMVDVADEQAENTQSSIDQVQDQIDEITEQIDGIENGMCYKISDSTSGDLTLYLDGTKLTEIEVLYGDPGNTPFSVDYGDNYGKIDYDDGGVTDFSIVDSTGNIMYEYSGVNWDNDPYIIKLVGDFAFGNDYLTRPLTSGASYGLYPKLEALTSAKNLLQSNKNKIVDSKTVFGDYT